MGILDEAIREHLDLKRQHGADDDELKQLEDDAFGAPGRPGADQPDPVSEAATEFMAQPDLGGDGGGEAKGDAGAEATGEPKAETSSELSEVETDAPPSGRREPTGGLVDLQEAPEAPKDEREDSEPADEEQPAGEHEAVREQIPSGPNTEERHAIADQPTEMFDVQKSFGDDDAVVPTEEPAPADEDLVAEEIAEPRLAPSEPIHDLEPADQDDESEEDDAFWNEQRLSDELDQALEGPPVDEPESAELEVVEPESTDHEIVEPEPEAADHEIVEPEPTGEHTQIYKTVPEPDSEEHEVVEDRTEEREAIVEDDDKEPEPVSKGEVDHDALEETPDFLEEAPEDDKLWFEQKPPKDFDFDD